MADNRINIPGHHEDYLTWRQATNHSNSSNVIEITDICVSSQRRVGRGKQLIEYLLSNFPTDWRVYAITRSSNEIAIQFYQALGFEVIGVLRRFYSEHNGADAIMFGRTTGGPV